jgi:hypothetical protein
MVSAKICHGIRRFRTTLVTRLRQDGSDFNATFSVGCSADLGPGAWWQD